MVIADNLAPVVNAAFGANTLEQSGLFWWVIVSMFAFQIYCDFSGYSDIARGLAKWMGYEFALNFDHPYVATSIREFWSRWHISLSTWFRDYVYIPLGGSRGGTARSQRNMWITIVVSGLWHGAAWTFVIWGALHALYLSIERVTDWPRRICRVAGGRYVASAILLLQVWIAWVFFRAESFGQALEIVRLMFSFSKFDAAPVMALGKVPLAFLLVGMAREVYFYFGLDQSRLIRSRLHYWVQPVTVSLVVAACVYFRGPGSAFIYFQF